MKNKLLSLGISALCLALVLIFGMMVIGCDSLLKTLENDDPETVVYALTLERSTPSPGDDWIDNWQGYYSIPSSITGGKITAGDVYTFTYAFKSNVAINGKIGCFIVDMSAGVGWKQLADYVSIKGTIPANTTVSGTIIFNVTETASSSDAIANNLEFMLDASYAASAPTLTFTKFSLSLVKKGNPPSHIMQGNAVTLSEKGTNGGNDFWQGYYEIPSSVTGGKITKGDVYTLTYEFKSDVDITGGLWANLFDNSKEAGWWKELSSFYHFNNYSEIPANTTVSGTVTFTAIETAYSASANANRLGFQCYAGTSGATSAPTPTLTFSTFKLVKTSSGNPQSNVTIMLSERSTGEGYDVWQGYYEIPSSVTGGKITAGDTYTFTYAFKSNVDIKSYDLFVWLLDETVIGGWKGLSAIEHGFISDMKANTTVSGTFTLTATESASSTTAAANKLLFQCNAGSSSGVTSAPTLTFSTFSLSKQ
jgi:hypothetical protein